MRKLATLLLSILTCASMAFGFTACGDKKSKCDHVYEEKNDITYHWEQCNKCDEQINKFPHQFSYVVEETTHSGTCYCGTAIENIPHNYDSTSHNENYHWTECACGKSIEKEAHTFNETNDCLHCNVSEGTEGLLYTLSDDGKYYICSGMGTATETAIVIPSLYNRLPVKKIKESAFNGCEELTDITIPNTITHMGYLAFANCGNLKNIYITDIVAWCSIEFFDNTSNPLSAPLSTGNTSNLYLNNLLVEELVIPIGATKINASSFCDCTSLTSVTIPDSVIEIGRQAFDSCRNLTSVHLPNGITEISALTFFYCDNLIDITIPDSVITIGSDAFANCNKLIQKENGVSYVDKWVVGCDSSTTEVSLREGTKGISTFAFRGNNNLKNIIIPNDVTFIDAGAFRQCSGLTSITLPDGVTKIYSSTFEGCSSLTNIVIPNSVTSIGEDAFKGCDKLLQKENEIFYVNQWAIDCDEAATEVFLREGTKGLASRTFSDCNDLTSVTIPDSVTFISPYTFSRCNSLTNVTFENPNNWKAGNIALSAMNLSDTIQAVHYLKDGVYAYENWTRTDK